MGVGIWENVLDGKDRKLTAKRSCSMLLNDTEHPIQPLEIALDGINYTIPAESLVFGFDDPTGWKESYCTFGIAMSTVDDGTA